jgi:hypothetical protein
MTDNADLIASSYIKLSLALDQHIPGYIDAYFGPTAWRTAAVAAGPQPVLELAREAAELSAAITTYHAGDELLDALFAARGEPVRWFRRLLTEPVTPSQVRAWIQER